MKLSLILGGGNMRYRQSVKKQLVRLLLLAWLFGILMMVVGIQITHASNGVPVEDIKFIVFVALMTGGFMMGWIDFWIHDEQVCIKKTGRHNTKTVS